MTNLIKQRKLLTHSRQAESAKSEDKTYSLNVGDGLFLEVLPNGSKRWRFRYSHIGKRKLISMGVFPAVSLERAKGLRDQANVLVAQGVDPSVNRQDEKIAEKIAVVNTFKAISSEWLARQSYAESTKSKSEWLLEFAIQEFGQKPITQITPVMVLRACRKEEEKGHHETAQRIKTKCSQVFRYAVASGRLESDPTRDLSGALITPVVTHRAAITDIKAIPELLRDIEHCNCATFNTLMALKLAPLVFIRPGELRGARWEDIDLDSSEWLYTPPKTRNQTKIQLIVPLARQVVEILKQLYEVNGHTPYVFYSKSAPKHKILSENTVNDALRRMGYSSEEMCGHGFRAMAKTILKGVLKFSEEATELQLGHRIKNTHGTAYDRWAFLDERIGMMQVWADYLDQLREGIIEIPSPKLLEL
jgi:integrase